jgi:hypothetical protein
MIPLIAALRMPPTSSTKPLATRSVTVSLPAILWTSNTASTVPTVLLASENGTNAHGAGVTSTWVMASETGITGHQRTPW